MRLLVQLIGYEKEQQTVGRMLMAYGEFEVKVARLMSYAFGGDADTAARVFFRVNGEAARLDVADAILRPFFSSLKLAGQWGNALGALRYCKNVRNQYAHCSWFAREGKPLSFTNLDQDAHSKEDILLSQLYPTDLELLQKQEQYFEYTNHWLFYLTFRCRQHAGEPSPVSQVPTSIAQPPPLHNRKKS